VEHTLADEIQPYVADVVRIAHLMDGALELVAHLHHAKDRLDRLHPQNFQVETSDRLALTYRPVPCAPPYAAPETLRDGTLTDASNVYTMGAILRDLLGDRPDLAPEVKACIVRATQEAPAARFRSIRAMRDAIGDFGWDSPVRGRWLRAFEPADERERELVVAAGTDADARSVYADWLEQHGFTERAAFVRDENAGPPEQATWRALVSRAPVLGCETACPRRWDLLERLSFDNIRRCPICKRPVYYCASIEVVMVYARQRAVVAIDASIPIGAAKGAHAGVPHARMPANPPAPRSYAEGAPGGNILTRLFDLFRRR
jgi:uncharacterized protein (TIGR02996 family)